MQQTVTDTAVAWYRTVTQSAVVGIRPAIAVGVWLALTGLFAAGGAVAALTGTAAVVPSQSPVFTVLALAGVLGSVSASPTLATATVRKAASVVERVLDTATTTTGGDWRVSREPTEDTHRRTSCCA